MIAQDNKNVSRTLENGFRSMIAIGTWRKLSSSAGKFHEEWGIPGEKDAR